MRRASQPQTLFLSSGIDAVRRLPDLQPQRLGRGDGMRVRWSNNSAWVLSYGLGLMLAGCMRRIDGWRAGAKVRGQLHLPAQHLPCTAPRRRSDTSCGGARRFLRTDPDRSPRSGTWLSGTTNSATQQPATRPATAGQQPRINQPEQFAIAQRPSAFVPRASRAIASHATLS